MKRTTRRCPRCGLPLESGQIRAAGTFPCPNCDAQLQASNLYGRWIGVASFSLSVGGSFALGFTGRHLIYAIFLLTVVTDVMLINLFKYLIPPKIATALPSKSFRQVTREIMGPATLDLSDKKPSSRQDGVPGEDHPV